MISRRHMAESYFQNYACHVSVEKRPSLAIPIDDGERLVRRPSRQTPEQNTITKPKIKSSDHDDDNTKKKSRVLKSTNFSTESNRIECEPQNQPFKRGSHESTWWSAGRDLRSNDVNIEAMCSSRGRRKEDGQDDFKDELSQLARIKEEVRRTVQSRNSLRQGSDALTTESERASAMTCRLNPDAQSCPDIHSVVDGFRVHDQNQTSARSSEPREDVQSHRPEPMDAVTQHSSKTDCRKRPLLASTALTSDAHEEQAPRRIKGQFLDPHEHVPNDRRDMSVPGRSRSRKRKRGNTRKELVSAEPCTCDRRDRCTCSFCGAAGKESPDSRRERLLLQERWNATVWHELSSLLQALPLTTTRDGRRQLGNNSAMSSSSNEAIYCCRMNQGKDQGQIVNHIRAGRDAGRIGGGGFVDKRDGAGPTYEKTEAGVQTQGNITPSVDLTCSYLRSPAVKNENRTVDTGCQTAADDKELDVHNCDSSTTEVTSIWPSSSGSETQHGTAGVTGVTGPADDACHNQEYLSLMRSISAELLEMSVSADCLQAAIDATTCGQPLDENSVLDAIDLEMADVSHFVKDTVDLSEIKPKEYIRIHMSILKNFTSSLEQFISNQKPTTSL